jgi:hypothetical protein
MINIRTLFIVVLIISYCNSNHLTKDKLNILITKDIEIVFTTTKSNYDEVLVTYYDFDKKTNISKPYVFKYDVDESPFLVKIILVKPS